MPRFLHTADWQIGRQYGQFDPDDAIPLAEARFAVVERIARLAAVEAVDAVLVAGDVFDAQTISDRAIRRLFNALEAYAGPWIMIPGNHDAALTESVWTRAQRLGAIPANAHVMLEPAALEFATAEFAVLAAPLTQRHTYADLTAHFDQRETSAGLVRIGLAHGCVQGILATDIDSPNPIAPDRAERARLDYLALGDWHGTRRIDARTWYSGTPEQDRAKANGAGQVLLVTIEGPGAEPVVQECGTGQYRWEDREATLAVATDVDLLAGQLSQLTGADVISLRLRGSVDLQGYQRLQQILAEAEARARCLAADLTELRLLPTGEDIAGLDADGYLGDVIDELRASQQHDGAGAARNALAILAALLAERNSQGPAA